MKKIFGKTLIFAFLALTLFLIGFIFLKIGYRVYIFSSTSMSPEIKYGSIVIVKEVPQSELKVDDIISYRPSDGVVKASTHRIVRIEDENGAPKYIVKGDASEVEVKSPVFYSDIIGKAVYWVGGVGAFLLKIRTPIGIGSIAGASVLLVVFAQLIENNKKNKLLLEKLKKKSKKKSSGKRASGREDMKIVKLNGVSDESAPKKRSSGDKNRTGKASQDSLKSSAAKAKTSKTGSSGKAKTGSSSRTAASTKKANSPVKAKRAGVSRKAAATPAEKLGKASKNGVSYRNKPLKRTSA
ncbi:MAG: signal peptidase I [Clostridiales bacterium]|nr:signal peptidase I [Clostridiales bacterium]